METWHVLHTRGFGWCDVFLQTGEEYAQLVTRPYPTTVLIAALREATNPVGMSARYEFSAQRPVEQPTWERLLILAQGRLPPGSTDHRNGIEHPDGSVSQFPWINEDGSFDPTSPIDWLLLPGDVRDLFFGPTRQDAAHLLRLANLIAWRADHLSSPVRFADGTCEWSVDGEVWRPWPRRLEMDFSSRSGIRLSAAARAWLSSQLAAGTSMPAAHELLLEAIKVATESPRAATVLAATAFETAVKGTAVSILPILEWLLQERPAPPALAMFDRLLPELIASKTESTWRRLSKTAHQTIEDGAKLRNRIVHQGADVGDSAFLKEYLDTVQRVLYLLDYYRGNDWALVRALGVTKEGAEGAP